MRKRVVLVLTIVAGVLTIAAPVVLSIHLADQAALVRESEYVLSLAEETLSRSETSAEQAFIAKHALDAMPASDPCSPRRMNEMRKLAFNLSYLRAVGYASGNHLNCSSLGDDVGQIDLGPADIVQPNGSMIRYNVKLPFAKDGHFLVLELNGFVAILHKDTPLEISSHRQDLSLAILSSHRGMPLSSRGVIAPEWIATLRKGKRATFVDRGFLVAVVPSKRYQIGTIAALPITGLTQRSQAMAKIIVPIGFAAAILLTLALIFLARQQLALPAAIKAGLRHKEFFLEYQPVVELATGRWCGAEALIRWRRAEGELVRPDLFIQVAEDNGLIQRITERVMELLARDVSSLRRSFEDFHFGINLSATDLRSAEMPAALQQLCARVGMAPDKLVVEITERCFQDPQATSQAVHDLRAGGIEVAIDDFGTGYSSLSSLENFELDYLKIDKAFVDTIGVETATSHVILHIIEMAKALNLRMIAEGVETEVQAQFLREHGVQYAQGWLFAKSMPIHALRARFNAQETKLAAPLTAFGAGS